MALFLRIQRNSDQNTYLLTQEASCGRELKSANLYEVQFQPFNLQRSINWLKNQMHTNHKYQKTDLVCMPLYKHNMNTKNSPKNL